MEFSFSLKIKGNKRSCGGVLCEYRKKWYDWEEDLKNITLKR